MRIYSRLASQAGHIAPQEAYLIASIKAYSQTSAKRVDEKRLASRQGNKKSEPVSSDAYIAGQLIAQSDTPKGRRDRFIMCLLLRHGLRANEVAGLTVDTVDMATGELQFYRPKTDEQTTHKMTVDTLAAAGDYLRLDANTFAHSLLLRTNKKSGELGNRPLNRKTVSNLVRFLGKGMAKQTGLQSLASLSAHDCRHYCATDMARRDNIIKELMDWFGWSSPAIAMHYVQSAEVHERNKG